MTLRITVDPEAESEIGEAAGWYEDRLTGLGLEFLAAVDRAFSSITGNPERFPVWKQGHPFRRYLLKRFPYVVFYEIEEGRVVNLGGRPCSSPARLLGLAEADVTSLPPAIAEETEKYLRTGRSDSCGHAWPGGSIMERAQRGDTALTDALVAEVRLRAQGCHHGAPDELQDVSGLVRRKVGPMVRGLFPRAEHEAVLALVENSVLFVGPATIEPILRAQRWVKAAWDLANLYLGSMGAELLGPDAPHIVGLSEETTCFVSLEYFETTDPFSDFVVHEVAHIFHNTKRQVVGLPCTRRREWMLDIYYRKRETFALACEVYSRILERATRPADRMSLVREYGKEAQVPERDVDSVELIDIVTEAAASRAGWKVILKRCAPASKG